MLSVLVHVHCSVPGWGMNTYGQLGYGDTLNRGDGANLDDVDLGFTCPVFISGFYWSECDGVWDVVDGFEMGGDPVYSRYCYGATNYLFKLTNPNGNGWDAWVIGYALDGSLGY